MFQQGDKLQKSNSKYGIILFCQITMFKLINLKKALFVFCRKNEKKQKIL